MEAVMGYVWTWLASGAIHSVGGAVAAYLFHGRIAKLVTWASALFNRLRS